MLLYDLFVLYALFSSTITNHDTPVSVYIFLFTLWAVSSRLSMTGTYKHIFYFKRK